jgi:hypothetical protein
VAGGEHRVEDWVGRFIGPDEPRFGSLIRGEVARPPHVEPEAHEKVTEPPAAEAAPEPEEPTIFHGRAPRPGPRRGHGRRGRSSWAVPAAAALTAIAVVAAVIVLPRLRSKRPAPPAPPAAAEAPSPSGTRHHGRHAASTARPAESESGVEVRSSRAPSPAGTPAADSIAAAPAQKYSLDVGSYLDFVRAREERDRLAGSVGLPAWVVTGGRDGGYHVVLGIYRTRARAESAVGVLLDKGLVSGAQVVPLPPRRLRD